MLCFTGKEIICAKNFRILIFETSHIKTYLFASLGVISQLNKMLESLFLLLKLLKEFSSIQRIKSHFKSGNPLFDSTIFTTRAKS